jgi:glycosyltransferase involved in cell wall biosynthesis
LREGGFLDLTVAICTHNPRPQYLARVLNALKNQTLVRERWELLLVDNASDARLADSWNLSWHFGARHVREDSLGLVHARLRAIDEAEGDILLFVDDDNVLDDDYLAECKRIAQEMPFLGAWGGQQRGEFEIPPQEWMKPYLIALAIREFSHTRWCNLPHVIDTVPWGAGLCVRTEIARIWSEKTHGNHYRCSLGRIGNSLNACEDIDLALTACDVGLGTGLFTTLRLTHLIPKERLDPKYLAKVAEGSARSRVVLYRVRGIRQPVAPPDFFRKCAGLIRRGIHQYRLWKLRPEARMIELATIRGENSAAIPITDS